MSRKQQQPYAFADTVNTDAMAVRNNRRCYMYAWLSH